MKRTRPRRRRIPRLKQRRKKQRRKKRAAAKRPRPKPKRPSAYVPSWVKKGLRNITVCIVGNGPSAEGKGDAIDKWDFVVRTSVFPLALKNAGSKINAWCWNGSPRVCPKRMPVPAGKYEMWLAVHTSYRTCYEGFKRHTQRLAKGHGPMRMVPKTVWDVMRKAVKVHPSTAFSAIAFTLEHLRPKYIVLYGFDATKKGASGWGDANKTGVPWRVTKGGHVCGHNMKLEKQLVYRLMKRGIWLGFPCKTKVIWPSWPKGAK